MTEPSGSAQHGESISFRHVVKQFETAKGPSVVLSDLSIDIAAGELVALVGPSGCGKSTILNIIAGLIPFEQGDVRIGDSAPREGRRDIGFMLQQSTLMPWRSVRENVCLPFDIARRKGADVDQRIDYLLDLVGLSHAAQMNPWELSGGMQQRVALARSLALDPSVMLLDEPFAALDEFKREHLGLEFSKMHEEMRKTSILVTHSIPEAVILADRVIALGANPGRVVADIPVTLPRPRTAAMIGTDEFADLSHRVREALTTKEGAIA